MFKVLLAWAGRWITCCLIDFYIVLKMFQKPFKGNAIKMFHYPFNGSEELGLFIEQIGTFFSCSFHCLLIPPFFNFFKIAAQ